MAQRKQAHSSKNYVFVEVLSIDPTYKALLPRIKLMHPYKRNDWKLVYFIINRKKRTYYLVFYNNLSHLFSGTVFIINLSNLPIKLDCGIASIDVGEGDLINMSGFGKQMYVSGLFRKNKNIRIPWIENNKKRRKKRKKYIKQCKQCKCINSDKLKLCSGCLLVWFCSKHCQKISWKKGHKYKCF